MGKRHTIETVAQWGKDIDVELVSKEYTCVDNKHEWKCTVCNHIWQSTPSQIKSDYGCPRCGGWFYTIEDIHKLVSSRNIKFLSKEFTKVTDKYEWQCEICDHIWETTLHNIKQGSGCHKCAGKAYTIEDMHALAKERGFKFLSPVFTKMGDKHEWECKDGHRWFAKPAQIKSAKTGCPHCNTCLNEEKCRFIFESITKKQFPKNRKVLGGRRELDGYCEELQMAFEYQGQQHYETMYYHNEKRGLKEQQNRDKLKRKLCESKGIRLIEIPFTIAKRGNDKSLEDFICQEICISGEINWSQFKVKPTEMDRIKTIATELKQECLTDVYRGDRGPIKLRCLVCQYKWESKAYNVKRRLGCPKCTNQISMTKKEVKEYCLERGIKFLSSDYKHTSMKYDFQCVSCQYKWVTQFNNIKSGNRCFKCTIEKTSRKKWQKNFDKLNNLERMPKYNKNLDERPLALWCGRQRQSYKKNTLHTERIKILESLSFWEWELKPCAKFVSHMTAFAS